MMYLLPMIHKRPYKAQFIASSSSVTTTKGKSRQGNVAIRKKSEMGKTLNLE